MATAEAEPRTDAAPKPAAKTDFERIKEVFKTLTMSDLNPIVLASISAIRDMGEFVEAIGKLEKKNKEAYDLVSQLGQQPETFLMTLIDKIPEDKLKSVLELSLRMVAIQTELKAFDTLTADRKIELGQELKKTAESMSKTIGELAQ
jgi:hypothetical protein